MRFLVLLPLLALAACATPQSQIRTALVDAGLSKPISTCMAKRMIDRLTLKQLLRLRSLSSLKGADFRTVTIGEFLHKARALGDPKILEIVTSAGIGCSLTA